MPPKRLRITLATLHDERAFAASENKCDGNEKQNAGCNRQNLDGVVALTVAV
jgi:hypothetical protein